MTQIRSINTLLEGQYAADYGLVKSTYIARRESVTTMVQIKTAYHIARREICGQGWEVCLNDLSARGHKGIAPSSEVEPGF